MTNEQKRDIMKMCIQKVTVRQDGYNSHSVRIEVNSPLTKQIPAQPAPGAAMCRFLFTLPYPR